jgi:hypothetical protein
MGACAEQLKLGGGVVSAVSLGYDGRFEILV